MKTKQKYNSVKIACQIDRQREIDAHGKIVSMRPSQVHKSKKKYNRKKNKYLEKNYE